MARKKRKYITGLDIGTTKICAIVGQIDEDGQLTVLGVGSNPSLGLKKGMVIDIDSTVDSIKKAVHKAQQMAGVDIKDVFVGIAGGHITSHNSRGVIEVQNPMRGVTEMDRKRVLDKARDVTLPRDTEIIHGIPQEYVCDGQAGMMAFAGSATLMYYQSAEGQEGKEAFLERRPADFSKFKRFP